MGRWAALLAVALLSAAATAPSATAAPATTLVSVSSAGAPANGPSPHPAISGDGRFVAFTSRATNLVPRDPTASRTSSSGT